MLFILTTSALIISRIRKAPNDGEVSNVGTGRTSSKAHAASQYPKHSKWMAVRFITVTLSELISGSHFNTYNSRYYHMQVTEHVYVRLVDNNMQCYSVSQITFFLLAHNWNFTAWPTSFRIQQTFIKLLYFHSRMWLTKKVSFQIKQALIKLLYFHSRMWLTKRSHSIYNRPP